MGGWWLRSVECSRTHVWLPSVDGQRLVKRHWPPAPTISSASVILRSAFWRPLKRLNFLSEAPVAGLAGAVSPYQMLDKLLGPQLQYRRDQKDLVAMLNVFEGRRQGRQVRLVSRLLIERDLETGLMAMAQGVGWPASIVACMIADGTIDAKGVLSPMQHIPYPTFIDALRDRGIVVEEEEMTLA